MNRPLVYDITRLVTRIFSRTPNGIDRVDSAFARWALTDDTGRAGLVMTPFGPRVISAAAAREALGNIRRHWGEDAESESDLATIQAALDVPLSAHAKISIARRGQYRDAIAWMRRHGVLPGESARHSLPEGVYLNVSQFPLSLPRAFGWLDRNPGLHGVFFVHDMLPLETPEFFRPAEERRHHLRLVTLARHARAAIVSSETTREQFAKRMWAAGRPDLPILVVPLPPDPAFALRSDDFGDGRDAPYFVILGTIEPRKNHLLILHVWREIVMALGPRAPKLLLIGERGWENEQVMDLIERCAALRSHVILASGLSTPKVRRLLAGACALLAPSLAEGYGLPVVEGLAAGVPVLASDIPVFRALAAGRATLIDPIDGPGWREAVLQTMNAPRQKTPRARWDGLPDWDAAFLRFEAFLDELAPIGR